MLSLQPLRLDASLPYAPIQQLPQKSRGQQHMTLHIDGGDVHVELYDDPPSETTAAAATVSSSIDTTSNTPLAVSAVSCRKESSRGHGTDETAKQAALSYTTELMAHLRSSWAKSIEQRALKEQRESVGPEEFAKQSESIETVRKEQVFAGELTEEEKAIVQKRIALQQQQFEEFRKRDARRRVVELTSRFSYLTEEETLLMLEECDQNEELVSSKLRDTMSGFLADIRKKIALSYNPNPVDHLPATHDTQQAEAYEKMVNKRKKKTKKAATVEQKEKQTRYFQHKRLSLKEAMQQIETKSSLEEAMKDWSEARIRAYKLIDENPNAYYYRFNAPNEQPQTGPWTNEEKQLFLNRLKEVGADGQWGLFSMAIPGRVGYQCSNYYRSLIRNGELQDANYVVDSERNTLHYLFTAKANDGAVVKKVRQFHRKKRFASDSSGNELEGKDEASMDEDGSAANLSAMASGGDDHPGKSSDGWSGGSSSAESAVLPAVVVKPKRKYVRKKLRLSHPHEPDDSHETQGAPSTLLPLPAPEAAAPPVLVIKKRKYTRRASVPPKEPAVGVAVAVAVAVGVAIDSNSSNSSKSSSTPQPTTDRAPATIAVAAAAAPHQKEDAKKSPMQRKARKGGRRRKGKKAGKYSEDSSDDNDNDDDNDSDLGDAESGSQMKMTGKQLLWRPKESFYSTSRLRRLRGQMTEEDLQREGLHDLLPGMIDPITLDKIVMPAISPTGHVMSFSSWLECIEHNGRCPITKQPIQKRDLVLLTPENIEKYRSRIVR